MILAVIDSADFSRCVRKRRLKDGTTRYACKLGLWSVEGRDASRVEKEARHYWAQYAADGEYVALLQKR